MTKKFLLGILFLVSINAFSQQDKKWSVEANYSVVPANGFGGGDIVIDLGLKYRFLENDLLKLGVGISGGYVTENSFFSRLDPNASIFLFQPRVFSEFNLPFSKRLRLTLGLGYSFFTGSAFSSGTIGGFNFNIALIYDISDKWFITAQYDFIGSQSINPSEGFNNFRLGIGYKF